MIAPFVEGRQTLVGWFLRLLLAVIATVGGAMVVLPILWLVGYPLRAVMPHTVGLPVLLIAAVALALIQVGLLPNPIPQSTWMVPRRWGAHGLNRYAAEFSFALGTGFATRISFLGLYLLALIVGMASPPVLATALFAAFALGRVLPLTAIAMVQFVSANPYDAVGRVQRAEPLLAVVRGATMGLAAGYILGSTLAFWM